MNPKCSAPREDLQRRLLRRLPWLRLFKPPAPTLNTGRLVQRALETCPPGSHTVLDLGCGPRLLNGTVRCDLTLGPPGVRADAARLPFRSATFDCVLATALLEHVPHPAHIVREIRRVLRPGGLVCIEVPFLEGYHADPDDYQRFTFRGLDVLLSRFEILEREVCVGPNSALTWILREYPGAWFGSAPLALAAKFVAAWITLPLKYLDWAMSGRPGAFRIAAGLAVLARRPDGS